MTGPAKPPVADGLVVVDKPAGWTSHDVVARVRRLAGTRKVGHAGTLDPMATGVLLLGVGRATRLLGHLTLTDKSYDATIRLGFTTTTDDAEGEPVTGDDASGVTEKAVLAGLVALTGPIEQVPSSVSAIKVAGKRAYARVRAGEDVVLAARKVTVSRLDLLAMRPKEDATVEVDVRVDCSSGTYVRALARDLGAGLGVGGHLAALRRTRVGPFGLDMARALEALEEDFAVIPLTDAVAATFPVRQATEEEATELSFGRRLAPTGTRGITGVFGPDGACLALVEDRDGAAKPLLVFAPAGATPTEPPASP